MIWDNPEVWWNKNKFKIKKNLKIWSVKLKLLRETINEWSIFLKD